MARALRQVRWMAPHPRTARQRCGIVRIERRVVYGLLTSCRPLATAGRAKHSLDKPELRVVILCDYDDKTFAVWTTSPQMPIFLLEKARAAAS
jgi:hypothetical protein